MLVRIFETKKFVFFANSYEFLNILVTKLGRRVIIQKQARMRPRAATKISPETVWFQGHTYRKRGNIKGFRKCWLKEIVLCGLPQLTDVAVKIGQRSGRVIQHS